MCGYISTLFAFTAWCFLKHRINFTIDLPFNITIPKKSQIIWNDISLEFSVWKSAYCLRNVGYTSEFTNSNYESKLNEQLNIAARSLVYWCLVLLLMLLKMATSRCYSTMFQLRETHYCYLGERASSWRFSSTASGQLAPVLWPYNRVLLQKHCLKTARC